MEKNDICYDIRIKGRKKTSTNMKCNFMYPTTTTKVT